LRKTPPLLLLVILLWHLWVGFQLANDDVTTSSNVLRSPSSTTMIDDPLIPIISFSVPSSNKQTLINHTVVMGQFNYDETIESVVFWHTHWKQYFQHVVVTGPLSEHTVHQLQNIYGILTFPGRADKGYSSPIKNMATVLQYYFQQQQRMGGSDDDDDDDVVSVQGVLYIHDDTLVNITELQPWLGSSTTIIASADTSNPRIGWENNSTRLKHVAETSYSILLDGSVSKVDGYHTNNPLQLANTMNPRWRWTECISRWYFVTMDPLSHAYREPDGSFLIPSPSFGGSDFLYIPLRFAGPFSQVATLLTNHGMFLECGFPKLVDILRRHYNATAMSVPLCTTFATQQRGTMDMIKGCSRPLTVVHPLKLGVLGSRNWTMAFHHIVNNKQNS
jgi:hypothetical protein